MIKRFDFDLINKSIDLIESHGLREKRFLLAISGGKDSIALFRHFQELEIKMPNLNWSVVHVHHGYGKNESQNKYRDRVQKFVQDLCVKHEISFFTNTAEDSGGESEQVLREFREKIFYETLHREKIEVLVKAHHVEDLLETRLIRLIRGTGADGFISMREFDQRENRQMILRPMLRWDKDKIESHIQEYHLSYEEDPSNDDENYFRNWLRKSWLPLLEEKKSGAKKGLVRSFENLEWFILEHNQEQKDTLLELISPEGLQRSGLMVLNHGEQRRAIALYLNKVGVRDFTHSQIDEILKRLLEPKKDIQFKIMNRNLIIDAKHIKVGEKV